MYRIIIGLVLLSAFSATGLYAHGPEGAGHVQKTEITEIRAGEQATKLVADIVANGKLDASWAQVQPAEVKKKTLKNNPEWVITFNNPREKESAKQKLYVFLSLYGDYLGANHTGN
ncbi:MAG: hypothetical protein HZB62_11795 [Nitrospirae bacterium]|nr:hypothetical protein [Nitrospirota bacterium]